MAFQLPNVDPTWFRGPDVVGSMAKGQEMAARRMMMDRMQREQDDEAKFQEMMANGLDPNDPSTLAKIYQNAPSYARQFQEDQRLGAKAQADLARAKADTAQTEQQTAGLRNQHMGQAIGGALQRFYNVDPAQRNDELKGQVMKEAHQYLIDTGSPFAQNFSTDPSHFSNFEAYGLGLNQGRIKDPFQEAAIQTKQTNDAAQFRNQLPPSQYEQARLNADENQAERTLVANQYNKNREASAGMRKEFQDLPETKNWMTIKPIIESAREAAKQDNGASELNLIYSLAKVLDPGSVVREGELSLARDTGDLGQRVAGYYQHVANGGRLTPGMRQELMNEMESRAQKAENLYRGQTKRYTALAGRSGLNANDVIGEDVGALEGGAAGRPLPELKGDDLQIFNHIQERVKSKKITPEQAATELQNMHIDPRYMR